MRNVLIVLSGPSGVGKGTIAKKLIARNPNLSLSISCTTRSPRNGEVNGREYFFIEKSAFKKKIEEEGFLEYSNHFENYFCQHTYENHLKKYNEKVYFSFFVVSFLWHPYRVF